MIDRVCVLVAEDQGLIALMIEAALVDAGLEVTVVSSGAEALAALSENFRFDVLVTDIRMGPGPTGWEVANFGRKRNTALHVIYITGDSMDDWRRNGVSESVILDKPFLPEQLARTVLAMVSESPPLL